MSDTESYVYRYSWDKEDLLSYKFNEHYVKQPEVLAYLEHVVRRHDLRKHMRFNTEMHSADWTEEDQKWHITTSGDNKLTAKYLITGLGLLSAKNLPDIPGIDAFEGDLHHTAAWPKDFSVKDKRVGVIGCGSTGVQVITEIGRHVKTLTCFQRHPQYSVPSGDQKITPEYRAWIDEHWDEIFHRVRHSITAFGFKESETSYHDATPEEREVVFEENWKLGNGFRFMFGTYNDIATNPEANEAACEFIRRKIDGIVKDPEKARKLKPHDVYARRPLCDGNASNGEKYFEQFNRPNVDIVDLKETPIERLEAGGVRTSDGILHELDVLIFATGFDAVEGNYTRLLIHGRDGVSLKDAWDETGPTSYLGVSMPGFPNLFMLNAPKGAFTNQPPAIEVQVEFVTGIIAKAERVGGASPVVEPTYEAEKEYSALCEELAKDSLFWKAQDNWIFGANVPGKIRTLRFFFGGMQAYREKLEECAANGYAGFKPLSKASHTSIIAHEPHQRIMATAAVARPTNVLRRRPDAPRISLGKRLNTSNMDGAENGQQAKRRKIEEPYVRTQNYILKKHAGKKPSLIIHLHNGFWKFGGQEGSFLYDSQMAFVLRHLRHCTVPHEMLEDLFREGVPFYDGCLIVEVHNHRTAAAKEKGKARDDDKKFSMHAYNEHITPSSLAPYPKKAQADSDAPKEKSAAGQAQQAGQKDKASDGLKISTIVMHPTDLSRHHETLLLLNTPASDMRSKKKSGADTPSSAHPSTTPSLSVPPTPLMTTRGPLTKDQKMCIEHDELNSFMADVLVTTQPPLYLDPAENPQDAERILQLLAHPLHMAKPPSPKTRKKTTAEMAQDDAQAAEAERRMLIMDERIKPSARTAAGATVESNQATAASLGFSRFKTIEMVRQKHEEGQLVKKEEADRAAVEKKLHEEQQAIRQQQLLQQQKQRELAVQMQQGNNTTMAQKQALIQAQRQHMAQQAREQQQLAAAREQHAHPNAVATAMMQAQQQQAHFQHQNMNMQGSPVMQQQHTPSAMMNSSPVMPNGGFPMVPTGSQGAGSPPRPTSAAMQNRNVQMARQASQQHGSQNNTPHIPQGTPSMPQAMPNRQMTQTPRLPPGSPAMGMQGTPTSAHGMGMAMPTPQMMQGSLGQNLTPEQIMMLQAQQSMRQQSQAAGHAGSPTGNVQGGHNMQSVTPEQVQHIRQQNAMRQQALMHAQQQQALANGQPVPQYTPQQQQQMAKMSLMRRQQQAQMQAQQQAQMQLQHMGMNGAASSPAPHQQGMQGHVQPVPTPQMAHAHPQTPQQQQMQQQQQQMHNGGQPPTDQQRQMAQVRAQQIALGRQAQATLQALIQQYGGSFASIPQNVLAAQPPNVKQIIQQQMQKQNDLRVRQQMQQQQMMQAQGGGGGGQQNGDGVMPASQPNPGYMQQLRQNQALLQQQMAQQQALQQQQQNGGGMGMGMGMNGMNAMNMQGFNGNGGGQQNGSGDGLTQHFANMTNALQRPGGNGMQ
ncbi:hypothetical protein LTR17_021259 [Elasticomyces elasticus]|nr:hypothetical protein LTR17_021259 [Elasticomyces elasticus]